MRYILLLFFLLTACDAFEPYPVSVIYWADGDSGEIDGERFRLADVDAPEIRSASCNAERQLGEKAKGFVREYSARGNIDVVADYGADRYGRRVIALEIDGQNISTVMKKEGYLRSWRHSNGRALEAKPDWC